MNGDSCCGGEWHDQQAAANRGKEVATSDDGEELGRIRINFDFLSFGLEIRLKLGGATAQI